MYVFGLVSMYVCMYLVYSLWFGKLVVSTGGVRFPVQPSYEFKFRPPAQLGEYR